MGSLTDEQLADIERNARWCADHVGSPVRDRGLYTVALVAEVRALRAEAAAVMDYIDSLKAERDGMERRARELAVERDEWQLLTESAELKTMEALRERDAAVAEREEALAQAAVMREALEWIEPDETHVEDGLWFERLHTRAAAALAPVTGKALLAELAALRDVADVANDALVGLAIGASVDVVMAPVRRAFAKLDALEDRDDA